MGVFCIDFFQFGVQRIAVAEFRRPEIKQHDLAQKRRKSDFLAVDVGHFQIGIARFGDVRREIDAGVHAGDFGQQ